MPEITEPIRVHSGNTLKREEIVRITRRAYTPIVFLAGDVKSGKTTLFASIHDQLLSGAIREYRCAGSETFMALEERCFESRVASGSPEADTPRTPLAAGQEYLHFRLRNSPNNPFKELLFADMSGEFYERAVHDASELAEFGILKRSDFLAVLLDGGKLMNRGKRHIVRDEALTFIRRCEESRLLQSDTALQVLISKWDLVSERGPDEESGCAEFVKSRLNSETLKRQVDVFRIAARPNPSSKLPALYGVELLFQEWVETVPALLRSTGREPSGINAQMVFNQAGGWR